MINIKLFCFRYDLRKGCIVYAWLQMMAVIIIVSKLRWLKHVVEIYDQYTHFAIDLHLSSLIALEVMKGISCLPLIWGVIKKNHMFYQPWLFINGLENAGLVLFSMISFIAGCFEPFIFYFLGPFIIFAGLGWYVWFCVYAVYKIDIKPNIINFDTNYENIRDIVV